MQSFCFALGVVALRDLSVAPSRVFGAVSASAEAISLLQNKKSGFCNFFAIRDSLPSPGTCKWTAA